MLDWLREKRQTERAIERYWRQVLVSAINEELDRMAAAHGFQVFWLGMIARADSYEMGIPAVPLRELYDEASLRARRRGSITASAASRRSKRRTARCAACKPRRGRREPIITFPACRSNACSRCSPTCRSSGAPSSTRPSPAFISGSTAPLPTLPHATLLDRTIQWMFNKSEGRYVQLVVSASRSLTDMPRARSSTLAVRELAEFFPARERGASGESAGH